MIVDSIDTREPSESEFEPQTHRFPMLIVLYIKGEPRLRGAAVSPHLNLAANEDAKRCTMDPWVIGRSSTQNQDKRLLFFHQRPGENHPLDDISRDNSDISRRQLWLRLCPEGNLRVWMKEGTRQKLIHYPAGSKNPVILNTTSLTPGDLLEVEGTALFYCTLRPMTLPSLSTIAPQALGNPDKWELVGESQTMWELRHTLQQLKSLRAPILLCGQAGVGRHHIAQALVMQSPLANYPRYILDPEADALEVSNSALAERVTRNSNENQEQCVVIINRVEDIPLRQIEILSRGQTYPNLGDRDGVPSYGAILAILDAPAAKAPISLLRWFRSVINLPSLQDRIEDIPLLAAHILNQPHELSLLKDQEAKDIEAQDPNIEIPLPIIRSLVQHTYTSGVDELRILLRELFQGRPIPNAPPKSRGGSSKNIKLWLADYREAGFDASYYQRRNEVSTATAYNHLRAVLGHGLRRHDNNLRLALTDLAGVSPNESQEWEDCEPLHALFNYIDKLISNLQDRPPKGAASNQEEAYLRKAVQLNAITERYFLHGIA